MTCNLGEEIRMLTDQIKRQVGLARIKRQHQGSLFSASHLDDLKRVLDPRRKVERYRRVWRLSKLDYCDNFLCGKLGFSKRKLAEETFYDEKESDFVTLERDSSEGAVSCFVLLIPNDWQDEALLAFEERPPDIYRQSFIGAFSRFLTGYDIDEIKRDIDFVPWLEEMDHITEFAGSFRRPNPRWQPRTEQVKMIIDQTLADSVKLEAKVERPGQSLNIEESILGGIVEHSKRGYGDYRAKGLRGGSKFNYYHGKSEVIEEIIENPSDTVREIFNKLIEIVRKRSREL